MRAASCFFVAICLCKLCSAANVVRIAYLGLPRGSVMENGWDMAWEQLRNQSMSIAGLNYTFQRADYYVRDDPVRARQLVAMIAAGKAADNITDVGHADIIVAGTAVLNVLVIEEAEKLNIPNIHCSGGNPMIWRTDQPHAFGMHLPYTWYARGAISHGKFRGMKTMAIIRSTRRSWLANSGVAALEWAQESGYEVIGPSLTWCNKYRKMTQTCRIIGNPDRCVCGHQSEADDLGYSVKVEIAPRLYEFNPITVLPDRNVDSAQIHPNLTAQANGILDDMLAQGRVPDVLVVWTDSARHVLYSAVQMQFVPKMWVGLPRDPGQGSNGVVSWDLADNALMNNTHGIGLISGAQWNPNQLGSDPLFVTNAAFVNAYVKKHGEGATVPVDAAACGAAGSVVFTALSKYVPSLHTGDVRARREVITRAIGDLNDDTIFGVMRFNKKGQSSGHGVVSSQITPEDADGDGIPEPGQVQSLLVLPEISAQVLIAVPLATFESRFGCPPGTRNTGNACVPCGPGRAQPNRTAGLVESECGICPTGFGTLPNVEGSKTCGMCPAGSFQVQEIDSGICRDCAPGFYRMSNMSGDACALCPAGRYAANSGKEICEICPVGTYQDDLGQVQCICQQGWYRNPLAATAPFGDGEVQPCMPCESHIPGSTTKFTGASSAAACLCPAGHYMADGNNLSCKPCAETFFGGSVTCNGFGSPPMVSHGFMSTPGSTLVYKCARTGILCPGGVPLGTESCGEGGSGIACSQCQANYRFDFENGVCIPCKDEPAAPWIFLMMTLLSFLAVCLTVRSSRHSFNSDAVNDMMRGTFYAVALTQLLDFLQTLSLYNLSAVDFNLSTAAAVRQFGGLFSLNQISPDCMAQTDAVTKVMLLNMIPAMFLLVLLICCLPSICCKSCQGKGYPSCIKGCNLAISGIMAGFMFILNCAINKVFTTYQQPGSIGSSVLSFPHILTGSDEFTALSAISAVAILLWCALPLSLMAWLCWYLQTSKPSNLFRWCTITVIIRYKDGYHWWNLVELATKTCLSLVMACFETAEQQQSGVVNVLLLYLVAALLFMPHRWLRHSVANVFSTLVKLILMTSPSSILSFVVLLLSGVFVIVHAGLIVKALWKKQEYLTQPGIEAKDFQEVLSKMQKSELPATLQAIQLQIRSRDTRVEV
eukprot:TRINITY_DN25155_c0_g1_i1.p1 TRINITY_DN25155_c0_g1~~TRINITY_DN25155_c0_g1_i1.p1  ORF type:complete len:1161 (-),score=161.65 TRINITY_DN25155_c0_g1_i1:190-3672(-)